MTKTLFPGLTAHINRAEPLSGSLADLEANKGAGSGTQSPALPPRPGQPELSRLPPLTEFVYPIVLKLRQVLPANSVVELLQEPLYPPSTPDSATLTISIPGQAVWSKWLIKVLMFGLGARPGLLFFYDEIFKRGAKLAAAGKSQTIHVKALDWPELDKVQLQAASIVDALASEAVRATGATCKDNVILQEEGQ